MSGDFDTLDSQHTMPDGQDKLLADRYRILRKLGEGGMGMVYLAEDSELDNTKVAVKFIPPVLAGNPRAIKNLRREAQVAMQLSHPNIVRLHDLHTDGHQKFLVMEYIEGKTLDELLAERQDERLSPEELLPIAKQIAAGLDYAHSKGVLHRDLKPSNIMIGRNGEVKLLDFGIAREMKDSYTRVTGQETSGTLPYMSPQQLMGEKPTASMDIYSFAAVVYECLAGCTPFHAGDIGHQILNKCPPPIAHASEQINAALQSALAKNCDERPAAAVELVESLGQDRRPKPHPPATPKRKVQQPSNAGHSDTQTSRRHWLPFVLAGCAIVWAFTFCLLSETIAGKLLHFLGLLPAVTIVIGITSRRPVVSLLCGMFIQVAAFVGGFFGGRMSFFGAAELFSVVFIVLLTGALGAGSAALTRRWAAKRDLRHTTKDESTRTETDAEQGM